MKIDDSNRDPVEVLADIYTKRLRDGADQSIAQFADEFPDYRQDIVDLFPTILNLEQWKKPPSVHPTYAESQLVEGDVLGDFEIQEEIARGGMGVVYRAKQKSLGRIVALKVLSSNYSSNSRQIERFKKEATAAARLHHTNIVPVFGVGNDRGFHFYAMQLIIGAGLDVVIGQVKSNLTGRVDSGRKETSVLGETIGGEDANGLGFQMEGVGLREQSGVSRSLLLALLNEKEGESSSAERSEGSQLKPKAHGSGEQKIRQVWQPSVGYWKNLGKIGVKVADALHYAHCSGILHRDIKPANILLDESFNIWVTDFGLAKQTQVDNMTQTGEVLGTFRYMAPEQFDGKQDRRSDLYSLGLTLYELCCLQPAFLGSSLADLIRQKTSCTQLPIQKNSSSLPKDLETIIQKCCSNLPEERYETAGQVADDLNRFIGDQPILARRNSQFYRLGRWVKRNPVLALTTCSTFILLLVTSLVSGWASWKTNHALENERIATGRWKLATQKAEKNEQLATKNLNVATEAFDRIFQSIAARGLPQSISDDFDQTLTSNVTIEDAKLLQELLGFYQKFADNNQDDENLIKKNAMAFLRMSQIASRLGQGQKALKSIEQGVEVIRPIVIEEEAPADLLVLYYQLLNQKGKLLLPKVKDLPGAHWVVIEDAKRRFTGTRPANELLFQIAQAYYLLGSNQLREHIESGTFTYLPSVERKGPRPPFQKRNGRKEKGRIDENSGSGRRGMRSIFSRFRNHVQRFDHPNSIQEFQYPIRVGPSFDVSVSTWLYSEILKDEPEMMDAVAGKALSLQATFLMNRRLNFSNKLESGYDSTIQFLEGYQDQFGQHPRLKYLMADVLGMSVRLMCEESDRRTQKKVENFLKRAERLSKELYEDFPVVQEYRILYGTHLRNLGRFAMTSDRFQEAETYLKQALDVLNSGEGKEFESVTAIKKAICLTDLASVILEVSKRTGNRERLPESLKLLTESYRTVRPIRMKGWFKDPLLLEITVRKEEVFRLKGDRERADSCHRESKKYRRNPFGSPFDRFLKFGPRNGTSKR